ncbi:MFS transporter [Ornithinimicrobium ciconiae]|uniref:Putative proline/betaine transporter n=1 Tax=Ornithinimicrobium ciconiae TaxID=2594265 RepID=A0A516GCT9_9MICO|nr:MFS transporter [Ornithinimicrobium ciconiae]QDO89328.1 MFS transporter [Ornithinimicrobium ciconiae]
MSTPSATQKNVDPSVLRKAIGASAIGNAVEWFDYGIYAYGTTYIAMALFPEDSTNAVLFTLVGFALSFLIRPLGGIFWGPLGDKIGRKKVLALTIILMASATFCVGLIPSYSTIGLAAPILLYLLRIIQGFSTGGEYGGAATFMAEYAPDRRRGFYGSFLEFGTLAGFNGGALLMLGLITFLDESAMQSWGWRIPFLVAGPLGLVGMYLRSRIEDTPVFRELEERTEEAEVGAMTKLKEVLSDYLPQVLKLFGLVIALNVVNYTLLSYMPTYLRNTIDLGQEGALIVPIIGQLMMMVVLPFVGALSDRVGRKPMWAVSLVGLAVLAIPMFHLMGTGLTGAIVGFAVLGLLYTPQLATISATFPAMFPTQVRFAALALSYNVATSLFGGTAPLVNEALIENTGDQMWPAYYMIIACVIGLLALWKVVETKGVSIRGSEVPGTPEAFAEQEDLAKT